MRMASWPGHDDTPIACGLHKPARLRHYVIASAVRSAAGLAQWQPNILSFGDKAVKIRYCVVACLMLAVSLPAWSQADKQIPAEMAVRFAGKDGMVCGKVESAKYAQNTEGQPTFLHMGAPFPRHTFAVKIMGANRDKWPSPPEELVGKLVCVIGAIKRAGGSRAEMEVDDPSNMKLGVTK